MSERPAPRLRTVDRQQIIPAMPLENLLDTNHQARLVWDFCLGLDLQPLYEAIRSRGPVPHGQAVVLDERRGTCGRRRRNAAP